MLNLEEAKTAYAATVQNNGHIPAVVLRIPTLIAEIERLTKAIKDHEAETESYRRGVSAADNVLWSAADATPMPMRGESQALVPTVCQSCKGTGTYEVECEVQGVALVPCISCRVPVKDSVTCEVVDLTPSYDELKEDRDTARHLFKLANDSTGKLGDYINLALTCTDPMDVKALLREAMEPEPTEPVRRDRHDASIFEKIKNSNRGHA